ncbi:MAG: hypothetical protein GF308_01775 [Candidatus Heimdallarchaeota archaeon]|nr:hypothetical protein [Candidatus Heimdallarchaeota archaeon]
MAITATAIAGFLTPILQQLMKKSIEKISAEILKRGSGAIKEKITQFLIEKELNEAINEQKVDEFIKKYAEAINEQMEGRIRTIAQLRDSFYTVEQHLKKQEYSEEAAEDFITLAKRIIEVTNIMPFSSAGIVLNVVDVETNQEIKVTDGHYMSALLLRYAAAAYTQIAHQNSPDLEGVSLSYDTKVKVRFRRPRLLREKPPSQKEEEKGVEYLTFRTAYQNLMNLYIEAEAISQLYLDGVGCLKGAQLALEKVGTEQEMHSNMTINHLKGLAKCFRGEGQYWIFSISDKLPTILETINEQIQGDKEKAKEFLMDTMDATEEDYKQFIHILEIYQDIQKGLTGAKELIEKGLALLREGKEKEKFTKRLEMVSELAGNESMIIIDEPKPIL